MTTQSEQDDVPQAPANPICGYVDCPLCKTPTVASVLLSKRNRKYLNCPVHNIQLMTNNACQQWIHENMRDTPQRKSGDPKPSPTSALPAAVDDDKKQTKPPKAKEWW